MKKRLTQSFLFAFIYVSLGTWELLGDIGLSEKVNNIIDGLDLYLVYPSHIIGSLLWWMIGGVKPETIYIAWIGQILNFLLFAGIFFIMTSIVSKVRMNNK